MLSFGDELSGYDLLKGIQGSVAYFWSPAKSHVYAELRRLLRLGWATERAVEQDARPDKRVYRITHRGRTALRAWLADPGVEPDTYRSPLLLKLFFGAEADRETLVTRVKDYREAARAQLAEFRAIERRIAGDRDALFPSLTLRAGLAHTRAAERWADDVLRTLEEESR
ncbi:MAG TPA: helix-turn-helix transcriptional regulator [Actinomycetota bacterium]|nr:helix-turn-helix transcriptional regulator [Actinomycetota bacterium]